MKLFRALALSLFVCAGALAQNAGVFSPPEQQFFDSNGNALAGGSLYFCVAGTSCPGNPLATYTDASGDTAAPNPVVLDSGGRASIWLGSSAYKIVAEDAQANIQWTADNVVIPGLSLLSGVGSLSSLTVTGNATIGGTLGVTGAATFSGAGSFGGALSAASLAVSGNASVGGSFSVTGDATFGAITGASYIGPIATAPGSFTTQGAYIGWNYDTGVGEMDFISSQGTGGGGFRFYDWNGTSLLLAGVLNASDEGGSLVVGDLQLTPQPSASEPPCSSSQRGLAFIVESNGSSTSDSLQVCILTSSGTYSWHTVF